MSRSAWLLLADKLGDNAQVERVAAGLADRGFVVARRNLRFLPGLRKGKPPFMAARYHLDRRASDRLQPPWPDLVLTVGRRPAMVAAWLQRRSPATRVVLFGRPRRGPGVPAGFPDLAVAPLQYALAQDGERVLALDLPLVFPDPARIAAARAAPRFAAWPRPLTAVLVGGATQPFRLDAAVARDLMERVRAACPDGSLFVTTSRRTGRAAAEAVADGLPAGAGLYRWGDPGENPYTHLLAEADRFVVTGDSLSMQVEVARLARPLAIAALPVVPGLRRRLREALGRLGRASGASAGARDLTAVHRWLLERGHAVDLGEPWVTPSAPPPDQTGAVVARISGLFDDQKESST